MNKNIFLILGVILAFFSSCQKNLKDIIHDTESATFIIYTRVVFTTDYYSIFYR